MAKGLALAEAAVARVKLNDWDIAGQLGLSVAAGLIVAVLYYATIGRRKRDGIVMPLTLVLMSVLVCMVMLIVGNDIARAFTLGGTLAIIRFRTVVDDTRDSAFVIASVVVGMGIGTDSVNIVFIGLPFLAVLLFAAALLTASRNGGLDRKVIIKCALDRDPDQITAAAFALCLKKPTLQSLETAKQGSTLEATYLVKLRDQTTLIALMNALRTIEGVQNVEVKP